MNNNLKLLLTLILGLIIGGFIIYFVNLGNLSEKWIGVVGSLGGVFIGGLIGTLGSFLIKQSEFDFQQSKEGRELIIRKTEMIGESLNELKLKLTLLLSIASNFVHKGEPGDMKYREYIQPLVMDVAKQLSIARSLQKAYFSESSDLMIELDLKLGTILGETIKGFDIEGLKLAVESGKQVNKICEQIEELCNEKIKANYLLS